MSKKKIENRYNSKEYEAFLNIGTAVASVSLFGAIGLLVKPLLNAISDMGLLGLLFECEQECESEFYDGIEELVHSEDFDKCSKPLIDAFVLGKTVTGKDCRHFYKTYKKWFTE